MLYATVIVSRNARVDILSLDSQCWGTEENVLGYELDKIE